MAKMTIYQQERECLLKLSEPEYREFSSRLLPGTENIIGVRLPLLRKEAKKLVKEDWKTFLEEFNRHYETGREKKRDITLEDTVFFEEIMLAGMVIGLLRPGTKVRKQSAKGSTEAVALQDIFALISEFVPKINSWSVCDSFCAGLKIAKEYREKMWEFLIPYLDSHEEYRIRFAVVMLLDYYIDEEYIDKVIAEMDRIDHEAYYVKMAVAWALSMCYVKFPERTLEYLEGENHLDDFTYNKTLQKAIESLKVGKIEKAKLRAMKR